MKNKKAIIAIVIITFIAVAIVFAWFNQKTDQAQAPVNWKTYTSASYGISVSIPNDWKDEWPADQSLHALERIEDYTIISSPDRKESMVFLTKPVDFNGSDCQKEKLEVNGNRATKITCNTAENNTIPGKINYEFSDKNLFIVFDQNTETISKILSSIK